jgi:hypothetical protein
MLKFLVNNKVHELPVEQLNDFPLKDSLLNMLYTKSLSASIGVKVVTENKDPQKIGAIVIDLPCKHFDKVLRIYAKPTITLHELLGLDFISEIKADHDALMATIESHHWTDQNLIDIQFMAHRLLSYDGYNLLIVENFKALKHELKFFGVYRLLEPKSKQQLKSGFDAREVIDRLVETLPTLFTNIEPAKKFAPHRNAEQIGEEFLHTVKSVGGYMSGSFVLKHLLNEEWDCHDIDIYVNETNLKGMIINNQLCVNGRNNVLSDKGSILKDFFTIGDARSMDVNSYDKNSREREIKYAVALSLLITKVFRGTVEKFYTRSGLLIDCTEKSMNRTDDANDEPTLNKITDESYCSQHHAIAESISAIVKLNIHGLKVDLVLVNVTVPYFIDRYFDFGFNKVFYDGYNITCLDWRAVLNKRCQNHFDKPVGSREVDFLTNISRIHKYLQRGFIIQPRQ